MTCIAPHGSRLPAIGAAKPAVKKPTPPEGWTAFPVFDPVKRTVHSTVPVTDSVQYKVLRAAPPKATLVNDVPAALRSTSSGSAR